MLKKILGLVFATGLMMMLTGCLTTMKLAISQPAYLGQKVTPKEDLRSPRIKSIGVLAATDSYTYFASGGVEEREERSETSLTAMQAVKTDPKRFLGDLIVNAKAYQGFSMFSQSVGIEGNVYKVQSKPSEVTR